MTIKESGVAEKKQAYEIEGAAFIPIATTTLRPPVSPSLIPRPRLHEQLLRMSEARMTVFKAPAGYGKTSLAIQWCDILRKAGHKVAWVRVTQELDDPNILLYYIAKAIGQVCPEAAGQALELLDELAMAKSRALAAALVNGLTESGEEIRIFLDDFDQITSREAIDAFWFLMQHAPRHFRVVLTTREEPALPLGALRSHGEYFEIDVNEFRFSLEETGRLFEAEGFHDINEIGLSDLQRDTGGWVAVLRITGSLLRAGVEIGDCLQLNRTKGQAVESFLGELVRRLPERLYKFMLGSSLLDALSPELCDEMLEIEDSAAIIDELCQRYQLLNQDAADDCYSYHRLIREFLKRRLTKTLSVSKIKALHLRAAHWHAAHGLATGAIRHAVLAEEKELAASWIEKWGMNLLKQGQIRVVLSWRRWLPRDLMRWPLSLRVVIGWSLFLAARRREARLWIAEIESDIATGAPDPGGVMAKQCLAIRVGIEGHSDAVEVALKHGRQYLEAPLPDPWVENVVVNVMVFGHAMNGRYQEGDAIRWREEGEQLGDRILPVKVYRLCIDGLSLSTRLRFAEARQCYTTAQAMAIGQRGPDSSLASIPTVLLAHLLYEQDEMEEAEQAAGHRLDVITAAGFLDAQLRAYILMARIAYRRQDNAGAHAILDRADEIAATESWLRMGAALFLERLRLFLDEEDIDSARQCLIKIEHLSQRCPASETAVLQHLHIYERLGAAFIAIDEARYNEVSPLLEALWQSALVSGGHYLAVRFGVLQAVASFFAGNEGSAMARFKEVLAMSRPAGLIRSIVDSGPKVGTLIHAAYQEARQTGAEPADIHYLERLQAACERSWRNGAVLPITPQTESASLTGREIEILRLLAAGHSNKLAAKLLNVSPETVKTHLKNIFPKLKVSNRMQAVLRARVQGLID